MPDLPLHNIASIITGSTTSGTDNKTLAMISFTCKAMDCALTPILRERRFVQGVYRIGFSANAITIMKGFRQELFSGIVNSIKTVGTKTTLRYSGQDTFLYTIEKNGVLVGRVAVTPVHGYWLEVEIYSVGRTKYIKETTLKMFPTYDTQGGFVAMDNGVDKVTRIRRALALDKLVEQIRRVCLA